MKTIVGVKRGIMLKLEKDKQKIEAKYREKIVKLGFHKESQIIDEVKYIIYIEKQDIYRESKFLPWKPKNKKNKKKSIFAITIGEKAIDIYKYQGKQWFLLLIEEKLAINCKRYPQT